MSLKIKDISFGYRNKQVLDKVSGELFTGKLGILVGENGAGKSTLIRCIGGHLSGQGDVLWKDQSLAKLSPGQRAMTVSTLFTRQQMAGMMTAQEYILLARHPFRNQSNEDPLHKLEVLTKDLGISREMLTASLGEISDGQCQLVKLAHVLMQDTPLILLDEPFLYLDYKMKEVVMTHLKHLAQSGKTILLSSHDLDLVMAHGDAFFYLKGGHLQSFNAGSELREQLSRSSEK